MISGACMGMIILAVLVVVSLMGMLDILPLGVRVIGVIFNTVLAIVLT